MDRQDLARGLYRDIILKFAAPNIRIAFSEIAVAVFDAADAFEAEELRRLREEVEAEEAPAAALSATPTSAAELLQTQAQICPSCVDDHDESKSCEDHAASQRGLRTDVPITTTAAPAARWGTIKGAPVAYHLWPHADADAALCGETEDSEEPILFRHDAPGNGDQICLNCICRDEPAAQRWREELGDKVSERLVERAADESAAQLETTRGAGYQPSTKNSRPRICLVPGCGLPGKKYDGRGIWCEPHAVKLDVNERTAIVIAAAKAKRAKPKKSAEVGDGR